MSPHRRLMLLCEERLQPFFTTLLSDVFMAVCVRVFCVGLAGFEASCLITFCQANNFVEPKPGNINAEWFVCAGQRVARFPKVDLAIRSD